MSSPAAPKQSIIPGISATENKLLLLAHVCLKNGKVCHLVLSSLITMFLLTQWTKKIDYDKLASNAGIKASSAHTLFRNAKRKLDKLYGDDNADADGNGANADMSPEETPSKRGKSTAKSPRAPKTPKSPKAPKTPKTPRATKATKNPQSGKAAIKSEESAEQVSIKREFSPITTEFAAQLTEDTSLKTAVTEAFNEPAAEPVTEPSAEPPVTPDAIKLQTENDEEENYKADENDEAAFDLAVSQHLPESPLPEEEDDAYEDDAYEQEDEQHED